MKQRFYFVLLLLGPLFINSCRKASLPVNICLNNSTIDYLKKMVE